MKFLVLMAVLGLPLAGCVSENRVGVQERLSPRTSEAVHSFSFQTCSATISGKEQDGIRSFLKDLGLRSDDVLVVSIPKGRIPLRDTQRKATLDRLFASYPAGVRYVQDTDLRELPRSESTGIIRVVRTTGIRVDCGPDGRDAGCAVSSNLAAMIARPSDTFITSTGSSYRPARSDAETLMPPLPGLPR